MLIRVWVSPRKAPAPQSVIVRMFDPPLEVRATCHRAAELHTAIGEQVFARPTARRWAVRVAEAAVEVFERGRELAATRYGKTWHVQDVEICEGPSAPGRAS